MTVTSLTSVDGVEVQYEDNGRGSAEDNVVPSLKELEGSGVLKLLKKAGYDKIRVKDIFDILNPNGVNGITDPCADGDDADINISTTTGLGKTVKHEIGHALNDILGEQNGRGRYSESPAFDAAQLLDRASQQATSQSDLDSINYYTNHPDEFVADIYMAQQEVAHGRGDSQSAYGGKITAADIARLYPNNLKELKKQVDDAIQKMNDSNGTWPTPAVKDCNDSEWSDVHYGPGVTFRWNQAFNTSGSDPLILDLDGNGIETTTLDNGFHFDVSNSGFASKLAWVSGNDGVLGIDLNGNNRIDSGSELIGSQLAYSATTDSFTALSVFDTNHDGLISDSDTNFADLIVQQANGSTKSLIELGISSISLGKSDTNVADAAGNRQTSISSYTRTDGTSDAIGSYVLQQDTSDTYLVNPQELSAAISALPNAAGSGFVGSLSQVMQADSSGQLQTLLESFLAESNLEVQSSLLDQILAKWTGSENAPAALHMDGEVFAVIKKFIGVEFVNFPGSGNAPGYEHQLILQPIYTAIKDSVYGQLMFNRGPLSDISSILADDAYYNQATEQRNYNLDRVADYLIDLASTDLAAASLKTSEFLQSMRGLDLFSRSNYQEFYDSVSAGNSTLQGIIDDFGVNPSYTLNDTTIDRSNVTIDETVTTSGNNNWVVLGSGNVNFTATGQNTWLTTQTGSYDIAVGGGTNNIYLGSGAATISATGADVTNIHGNIGDNQLNFGQGSGVMNFKAGNVNLQPHNDSVNLGTGLDFSSVSLSAQGSDLVVQFGQSASDQLILRGELAQSSAKQISTYSFANGTILTAEQFGEAGLTFEASGSSVTFDHSGSYVRETINLSGSNSTLRIGTVQNTVNASGNSDFIYGGNSDNIYNVTGSSNTILAGS
ncbi:MAG: hypothetical protein CTY35_12725, partial [Methylotenera sp.]